jgi:hypothetical protein
MTLEIWILVWYRHKNVSRVKPVNGIPSLALLMTGTPMAIHIQTNDKKTCTEKAHILSQK